MRADIAAKNAAASDNGTDFAKDFVIKYAEAAIKQIKRNRSKYSAYLLFPPRYDRE